MRRYFSEWHRGIHLAALGEALFELVSGFWLVDSQGLLGYGKLNCHTSGWFLVLRASYHVLEPMVRYTTPHLLQGPSERFHHGLEFECRRRLGLSRVAKILSRVHHDR
jgi:hypothetical protein